LDSSDRNPEAVIMKRATLVTVSALFLAAPVAQAAPPPAAWSWTGFYLGGNAGYTWGHSNYSLNYANTGLGVPPDFSDTFPPIQATPRAAGTGSLSPNGAIGGVQAGYNVQFNQVVLGVEADFSVSGLGQSSTLNTAFPSGFANIFSGFPITVNTSIQNPWLMTLRPRLGWAMDRSLFYVTGGLAVGQVKFSQVNEWQSSLGTVVDMAAINRTKTGWTVGGGLEQALNNNWSVRAEYLYTDLGSVSSTTLINVDPAVIGGASTTFFHKADLITNTVRVGVVYNFAN
jgi:outer membrane immunogenic protein